MSLNRLMNWPTIAGITFRSACGSTMSRIVFHGLRPIDCAGLDLTLGHRLQAAAHDLGDVRGLEEGDGDQNPEKQAELDVARDQEAESESAHQQQRDHGHAAQELDVRDREQPDGGQGRATSEREHRAEGERQS